jgi:hypothetical protein
MIAVKGIGAIAARLGRSSSMKTMLDPSSPRLPLLFRDWKMHFPKPRNIRTFLLLIGLALFCPALPAKEPPELPETLLLPAGPLPNPPKADPATEQRFRQAIQQGAKATSNDSVVDEMLDVMRRNGGSILEGSSLDPKRDWTVETKARQTPPPRSADANARSFRTAEQLLKTARLLDKIQPISENRKRLVNQMRQEAVRLMKRMETPDLTFPHPNGQQSMKPSAAAVTP